VRDRVGEVLDGKFRLLELIGSGGMGSVYQGEHLEIGKRVAVKFMHVQFARNPEAVRRFHQEARAAAAAGHPGIVDIYDIGRAPDGAPYLVMELLDGESLGALLLREKVISVSMAVAIARGALSALAAAHKKGVVHRDIKPDNVFLEQTSSEGPSVKLLDFGVSKMSQLGVPSSTVEGTALGTPHYMAPEQARGELTLDARVDVYAMGVILYEMLAGALPFDAPNYHALILKVVSDPPRPLRERRPELPEELAAVVMKALAKTPADRFASAEALAEALRPFRDADASSGSSPGLPGAPTTPGLGAEATHSARQDTPTPRTWVTESPVAFEGSGRWRWMGAGLAGLVVVGVGAYLVGSGPADVVEARWTDLSASTSPTPPPAPGPQAASPPAQGAAPGSVAIALEGAPPGARVFLDDARVPQLPMRIPRGDVMRRIRVEADGHAPLSTMVVPDRDQTLTVTLTAEPAKAARPPGKRRGIFRDTSEFDR
jgi:serine/threonine protein kinase